MKVFLLLAASLLWIPESVGFASVGPGASPTRTATRTATNSARRSSQQSRSAAPRVARRRLATSASSSTSNNSNNNNGSGAIDWNELGQRLTREVREISECVSVATQTLLMSETSVQAADVVQVCDELDALTTDDDVFVSRELHLRRRALEFRRYELLSKLLASDYQAYVATASFLSPSRIPRHQLPNVQDVPYREESNNAPPVVVLKDESGAPLVNDCELDDVDYQDTWLDKLLLNVFRKLVEQNTGGISSPLPGILGLLEQGRTFMLQPGQTAQAQHQMVSNTLGGLMTPYLPPFYRVFMSGIVPKLGTDLDGKQFGPWFYAPFLTSIVTPTFFAFLVGPSKPNRRKDGQLGGLVVEKCKFLQVR